MHFNVGRWQRGNQFAGLGVSLSQKPRLSPDHGPVADETGANHTIDEPAGLVVVADEQHANSPM
jgi:hypothetical protein